MNLITRLKLERDGKLHGGIYDITQKRFAYNSNRIEGSRLTEEQTSLIYDTKMISNTDTKGILIDDIIETTNHFKCFDYILDTFDKPLTDEYIKHLHYLLKHGTSQESNPLTPIGQYKVVDNEVGTIATTPVERVEGEMLSLLIGHNFKENKDLSYMARFHIHFEQIHPFADGNGRIGRLLLYKECLKENILPFIIDDENKLLYYNALENAQFDPNGSDLIDYFIHEQRTYDKSLKEHGFEHKPIDQSYPTI